MPRFRKDKPKEAAKSEEKPATKDKDESK
jgi:hypothetical protein